MSVTYRCMTCLEHTVARAFDVSHLSLTCPTCESFERLVNQAVVAQFRAFEDEPPDGLDWEGLSREEKLLVSERVARRGRSPAEMAVGD